MYLRQIWHVAVSQFRKLNFMLNSFLTSALKSPLQSILQGGGSTLWTPSDISSANIVYQGDASKLTGTGNIAQLDDLSGNDNHATQATTANQGEVGVRTLNSLNLLTARSGSKHYDVANTPTARAIYSVINTVSTSGTTILVLGGNSTRTAEFFIRGTATSDISFDGDGTQTGKYSLNGEAFSANAENHTTTDAPQLGGNILSGVFSSDVSVSTFLNRSVFTSDATGHDLGELIITDAELSTEDQQKLEGYYAHKWGLTALLPENHPYKYDGSLFGYPNGTVGNETGSGTG